MKGKQKRVRNEGVLWAHCYCPSRENPDGRGLHDGDHRVNKADTAAICTVADEPDSVLVHLLTTNELTRGNITWGSILTHK